MVTAQGERAGSAGSREGDSNRKDRGPVVEVSVTVCPGRD